MNTRMPKRFVAWLLAAMVALIVAPNAAFADNLAAGDLAAQGGGTAWTDIADDAVVFTVYADEGDGVKEAKAFTKAEMDALAAKNTAPAKYVFTSKKGATVAVATKYATVDQLLSEAKVDFKDSDTIIGWSDEFTPSSATPYEGFADRKFFPAFDPGSTTQSTDGSESTPAIVAIEYGTATLASGSTAASVVDEAQAASSYSALRNFWGKTDDELNGNMGGNSYCSGATYLTVATPFKIYTRTGNGDKTLVKSYTSAQLAELATAPESAAAAPGYLFNKNGWQVGTTTKYIPIEKLLSDAGITLKEGQKVAATASDGFTSYLTYEQVKNAKYFYPATTSSAINADGAEEVGAVLALNWAVSGDPFPAVTTTAGATKAEMFAIADKFNQQTRVFVGLFSATDDNTGGNRFATGPVELSVVSPQDISTCAVSGVDASYTYTGSAIEPAVSVKDGTIALAAATRKGGDYEVSYENNVAVGTGKVVITGVNAYTGTKTVEFKIAGIDLSKATVSVKKATYTGKALKPAVTVKLGDTTLVNGTDYTVVYSNNKKVGKNAVATITGKGNYAGQASKNFTIVKAANTFKVKAVKATQTVKYNKKKNTTIAAAKAFKVTKNVSKGKVTYKKTSGNAKITVSKAGKVIVKKGLAKKTYTVKVKVTSAATANYKAASKVITLKVKVK